MKIIQIPLAVAIALSIGAAFAQATTPVPAASAAAGDCRHDHRAEKGTATAKAVNCGPAHAAAGASKPMHEHARVHKQQ